MSTDATLRTLMEELMESWDDTVDTSAGSSFETQVMTPLLTRIGGSPLDVDLESFIVERLETEITDIDVSPLSGLRDLLVRAAVVILDPIRREISSVKLTQSLNNYEIMIRDEVNALLGNYFLSLEDGDKATGVVRLYFLAPQSTSVTPLTRFSTGSGLNFYPTAIQSISSTLMQFNVSGSLYYFDVTVQAENTGTAYNVDAGSINTVQGITGVVRIENLVKFDDATSEETKAEGVARAQESITIRNLAVERGISVVLSSNYSFVDVVQVIGKGDAEMQRDVVVGPVTVSDVPGGIVGKTLPTLGSGAEIHIGGKTDVYVYQPDPVSDSLDFQDLTDVGLRVYAADTGFTAAGGAAFDFEDERGHFPTRGVQPGDVLRVGEEVRNITGVSDFALTLDATLDGGLFNQTYEVVRFTDDVIIVPLYDLVAEDSSGNAITDEDGDPVQPIPGSVDNEQLLDGSGSPVKKANNIAANNVLLPLIRVETVEFLDPLTLEASGVTVPMSDALLSFNDTFSGGTVSTKATGTIRTYYRDAVSAWAKVGETVFTYASTLAFVPQTESTGTARVDTAPGSELILEGADYTGVISPGYRISYAGAVYTVLSLVYSAPDTVLTVREEFSVTSGPSAFVAHIGVLEADMPQDTATGLYYFDVPVVATLNGTAWNLVAGTTFDVVNLYSEGWSLKTYNPVLSYSTKELPHIEFSRWVNDDTDLEEPSTAYAIRVNYDYASLLPQLQDFVESEEQRIVAEDVLIKHFQPSYVRVKIDVENIDASTAQAVVRDYIDALDPTDDLEASDLVDELYGGGATHVLLPMTLVGMAQSESRTWSATIDQDTLGSNRIQHFRADGDFIEITEET